MNLKSFILVFGSLVLALIVVFFWGCEKNQPTAPHNQIAQGSVTNPSGNTRACGTCNWYGTNFPVCCNQNTGWGWEDQASCIGCQECLNAGQTCTNCTQCNGGGGGGGATTTAATTTTSGGSWWGGGGGTTTTTAAATTTTSGGGGGSGENTMGYCGCSMAENVANGYRAVGGRRMWGGYGTGGLVVQNWTNSNSSAWQKFDQQAAQYGKPTAVWVQVCIFASQGATYDEVRQMVNAARQHAASGATIYITGQPLYSEGNVCDLAGSGGPEHTDDLARQAGNDASLNVTYSGTFTLRNSEVSDGCHANSAGEQSLGNQAVNKWGRQAVKIDET